MKIPLHNSTIVQLCTTVQRFRSKNWFEGETKFTDNFHKNVSFANIFHPMLLKDHNHKNNKGRNSVLARMDKFRG